MNIFPSQKKKKKKKIAEPAEPLRGKLLEHASGAVGREEADNGGVSLPSASFGAQICQW